MLLNPMTTWTLGALRMYNVHTDIAGFVDITARGFDFNSSLKKLPDLP